MISSVVPTRSSTFYAYVITKIENRNLKLPGAIPALLIFKQNKTPESHFCDFILQKNCSRMRSNCPTTLIKRIIKLFQAYYTTTKKSQAKTIIQK